ncbi:MAG: hypothetical protein WAN01_25055, partial [Bradyrhizobium sp.]
DFSHPASIRGALAIVTNVGRDAVDAEVSKDERRLCPAKPFLAKTGFRGRRSRVVLTPRRWR